MPLHRRELWFSPQGLPVVRQRGDEQGADGLAATVVPGLRSIPPPVQAAEELLRGVVVLAQHHRGQFVVVAGPARSALPGEKVLVAPDAGLEADVDLAYVVQGGEEGQPRHRRVIQRVQATGACQPLPDVGLGQQRLEAGPNIGQVMLQQVDALRPLLPVGLRLGPEPAGVVRRVFSGGHVRSYWAEPAIPGWAALACAHFRGGRYFRQRPACRKGEA